MSPVKNVTVPQLLYRFIYQRLPASIHFFNQHGIECFHVGDRIALHRKANLGSDALPVIVDSPKQVEAYVDEQYLYQCPLEE